MPEQKTFPVDIPGVGIINLTPEQLRTLFDNTGHAIAHSLGYEAVVFFPDIFWDRLKKAV